MSNSNPNSRTGRRDGSGKYNNKHGYKSKSNIRRRNKVWIPRKASV